MPAAAAETPTERIVAGIWSDVLNLAEVDVTENFFDLGGHSVLLHMVGEQLVRHIGTSPDPVDMFRYPTVRSLAAHIDGGVRTSGPGGSGQSRLTARSRQLQRTQRSRARTHDLHDPTE